MDGNLLYLIIGVAVVAAIALLYPIFYRTRKTEGTDELNWVNKSNYNIAAPEADLDEIERASPAEAREIARDLTSGPDAVPVNDEEFNAINGKLDGPHTASEVKEALKNPE